MIDIIIPVNKLGYGIHALGMTKELLKNSDNNLIPIGGTKNIDCDDEKIHEIIRTSQSSGRSKNNKVFIFWHLDPTLLDFYKDKYEKIYYFSTWEFESQTEHFNEYLKSLDAKYHSRIHIGSTIKHFSDQLKWDNTYAIHGFASDYAVSKKHNPIENMFIHVGKYEARKNQDAIIESFIEFISKEKTYLNLFCHNPFESDHYLTNTLKYYGFRQCQLETAHNLHLEFNLTGTALSKGNKIINLFNRVDTNKKIIDFMSHCEKAFYPSYGEGWNLSYYDSAGIGMPICASPIEAHAYINQFYITDNIYFLCQLKKESYLSGKFYPKQSIKVFHYERFPNEFINTQKSIKYITNHITEEDCSRETLKLIQHDD